MSRESMVAPMIPNCSRGRKQQTRLSHRNQNNLGSRRSPAPDPYSHVLAGRLCQKIAEQAAASIALSPVICNCNWLLSQLQPQASERLRSLGLFSFPATASCPEDVAAPVWCQLRFPSQDACRGPLGTKRLNVVSTGRIRGRSSTTAGEN